MNKPKDKIVFLFGAGAVIDWGGPKTICVRDKLELIPDHGSDSITNRVCCLTHLITGTGFEDKEGNRITKKIYDILRKDFNDAPINFETIINIVEDLHGYWTQKGSENPSNLNSLANIDDQIRDFAHFNISHDPTTKRDVFSIPGYEERTEESLIENTEPNARFFELLLNNILTGIKGHISKYAYHTSSHSLINKSENARRNENFCEWMAGFIKDDSILRMYTLNYDRLFKVILEKSGLEIFEGFDNVSKGSNPYESMPLDIPRIVSDFSSNVHYNLHGSVFWDIEFDDNFPAQTHRYMLVPFGEINNPKIAIEIERGRKLIASTIITGYQKVQRTAIAPFRQMFSAFDRDCFEATKIFLIGYSLGDEHINDIIRNARRYNTAVEITIVTPNFNEKDELDFFYNFLICWGVDLEAIVKLNGNFDKIFELYKINIVKSTFEDFLESFRS